MHRSKFLNVTLLCALSAILFSCGPQYKLAYYFHPEKMIPPDFNPKKHVLLFAEFPRKNQPDARHPGYTAKMEKVLQKYYPYKYEIITRKDAMENRTKYADTSVYKFAVLSYIGGRMISSTTRVQNTDVTGHTSTSTVSPTAMMYTTNFHFYDRSAAKNYPGSDLPSSNFMQEFSEFVKMIANAKYK